MKIAAIVILYHPSINTLRNIQSYAQSVGKVFVFDNTEGERSIINKALCEEPNIDYFHDGENKGIAERLNQGAKQATQEGFDWLLMMDQDSQFQDNAINLYFDCIKKYTSINQVALFGTNFSRDEHLSTFTTIPKEVDVMITSGTILNLHLYQVIGEFDEALFIDAVDVEYCLRAKKMGYSVIQLMNIFLKHELGNVVKKASIKTLFLVKKKKELHSALRYYYIHRNNLYLQEKYKNYDRVVMKDIDGCAKAHLENGIFYGRNTTEIIKYLIAAYQDFKHNKMGKYQSSSFKV
jgi:rhamnosyltransferase